MSETYFTYFYLLQVNSVIIVLSQMTLLKWPSDASVLSKKVFVIIWEISHRRISLNLILLLLVKMSGFRLELMCMFLIINI